jgi:hypothetical protein
MLNSAAMSAKEYDIKRIATPGIKPIAGKKEREKEENVWVHAHRDPEGLQFGLPRWLTRSGDRRPVCTGHCVWVNQ